MTHIIALRARRLNKNALSKRRIAEGTAVRVSRLFRSGKTTNPKRIGILHPGAMGVSVAAAAARSGNEVYWISEGRSQKTRERAAKHGLRDAGTLAMLCTTCNVILSICPPHAAEDVANAVTANHFRGIYLDANAISPQRAIDIGERMTAAGIDFVDGGIIGSPAWKPGETWLYLSGLRAGEIAACFVAGPVETQVIGNEIGRASALKMSYSAWTKGTTALLAAILTAAEQYNVRNELYEQWNRDYPKLVQEAEQHTRRVTAKAWRFAGEMEEIAATFEHVGLPGGFHQAAAEIYRRIAFMKELDMPPLDEVLEAISAKDKKATED